jgi:hypothetical protein
MKNAVSIEFVSAHRLDDVRRLALQAARYPDVDMPWALDQIQGWQTARHKLPSWAATEGIVYPPHLSMEQCSSEFTARYKAEVAARIAGADARKLVDLTGGFGIDFSFMSRKFDEAVYVERQEQLCAIVRHNVQRLDLQHVAVLQGDATDYLHQLDHASVLFLDPARRDANGAKTVGISDCTPDVMTMKEELLGKSDHVMLKLSPMLDWHQAVSDLGCVAELHIVSVANECKELLLVLSPVASETLRVYCVNDDTVFEADDATVDEAVTTAADVVAGNFLYEPNASIMKAGCFGLLCRRYGVGALSVNSHLLVSPHLVDDFPGRKFQVQAVCSMNKKALRQALAGVTQANIAVRNFPQTAEALRRRLKLKDGGSLYLFATTLSDGSHVLIINKKMA